MKTVTTQTHAPQFVSGSKSPSIMGGQGVSAASRVQEALGRSGSLRCGIRGSVLRFDKGKKMA